MDRRTFNKTMASGAMWLASPAVRTAMAASEPAVAATEPIGAIRPKWPEKVYRRLLVDTHVRDWDPVLLSRFDARDYVVFRQNNIRVDTDLVSRIRRQVCERYIDWEGPIDEGII